LRSFFGGCAAGAFRAVIECPFEYSKVRRQTNQAWQWNELYTGFGLNLARNVGLLASFIMMLDSCRRHTNFFDTKTGQFFATGFMAVAAFWTVWPFEFLKNQIQAERNNEFGATYN